MNAAVRGFHSEHAFLSNSFVETDGLTVEHRYQAAKAVHDDDFHRILAAPSGSSAKRIGNRIVCRADWETTRDQVMVVLIRQKFRDPELASLLLATGAAALVERTVWGASVNTELGENRVGLILAQVREEIRYGAVFEAVDTGFGAPGTGRS